MKLLNDRQIREMTRNEELQKKQTVDLTAEHVTKARYDRKRQKDLQTTAEKNSRRKMIVTKTDVEKAEINENKDSKEKSGKGRKTKDANSDPPPKATKVKTRQLPQTQGTRKLPIPCDKYGCPHVGVLDLNELPRSYLKTYVKKGGWLYQMPCYDCKKKSLVKSNIQKAGTVQVLEVAELLKNKKGNADEMARYCNYGVASHGMKVDDEWKKDFECNMVLCVPCYTERLEESGQGIGGKEKGRRRTRSTR